MLSEHTLEGWLEGYLLTGRHGFFSTYEAFAHIIDSMVNQHAKWLDICNHIPWRQDISSLNLLITSTVWRQDHNGFTHQDPGFLNVVLNKSPDVVRIYLPPDVNSLLSVVDHCLRSVNYINVIVSDKQSHLQYHDMDAAIKNRQHFPDLKIRFINAIDLFRLQPKTEHPHGMSDRDFDSLFTLDKPIIFNFHGYPWLIHRLTYRLTYRRANHHNLRVRGYKEKLKDEQISCLHYAYDHGTDRSDVVDWKWPY